MTFLGEGLVHLVWIWVFANLWVIGKCLPFINSLVLVIIVQDPSILLVLSYEAFDICPRRMWMESLMFAMLHQPL